MTQFIWQVTELRTPGGTLYLMPQPHPGPASTLLVLAKNAVGTLADEHCSWTARLLYRQGWNVVTLDLPSHGEDHRPGTKPGLDGWAERLAAGEDIVAGFQQRVGEVLDAVIASGHADPDRIGVVGTSRGAFMACHAAAADPRLRAVVGIGPVTRLPALREFAGLEEHPLVTRLALVNVAAQLAARPVWLAIGNADDRVDTDSAVAFARALARAAADQGVRPDVTLQVHPTPGHQSQIAWYEAAVPWLQEALS